jgi:hypothetical protein
VAAASGCEGDDGPGPFDNVNVGSSSGIGGGGGASSSSSGTGGTLVANCNVDWINSFGDNAADVALDIAATADGTSYVIGVFVGTLTFGGTTHDMGMTGARGYFLGQLDPGGQAQWSESAIDGQKDDPSRTHVTVDDDGNVYAAFAYYNTTRFLGTDFNGSGRDVLVAKMDASGAAIWSKTLGGADDQSLAAIRVDGNGDVYLSGDYSGTADFEGNALPGPAAGVYVAKLAGADGAVQWATGFPAGAGTTSSDMAVDANGNTFLTGYFYQDLTGPGAVLNGGGFPSMYLIKVDASGGAGTKLQFETGQSSQQAHAVAVDSQGDVLFGGWFTSKVSFGGPEIDSGGLAGIVVKYDNDLDYKWATHISSDLTGAVEVQSIAVDGSDNIYVGGSYKTNIAFDPLGDHDLPPSDDEDGFIALLSPGGGHACSVQLGGAGTEKVQEIATDAAGNAYVAGRFGGELTVGTDTRMAAGNEDAFVLKLSP